MPWDFYWTIVFQLLLAVAILTVPVAIAVFIVSSASYAGRATKTMEKDARSSGSFQAKK